MKKVIPFLILMSLWITEAVAQSNFDGPPPINVSATGGDRSITVRWQPPSDTGGRTVDRYSVDRGGARIGVPGAASARSYIYENLPNGTTYNLRVRIIYTNNDGGRSGILRATAMIPAPTGLTATFDDPTTGDRTATLNWTAPSSLVAPVTYEYSQNGGPWIPTRSASTTHSVTGLENGVEYSFRVRATRGGEVPGRAAQTGDVTPEAPRRRRVIQDCPVGWVRSDGFTGRNRRVLLYEVKLDMDFQNRVSIYKPVWVAIYVHPEEGLENLDGWKLQVAVPYNHHRDYLLTAENSVVVDAEFVEGGFAFIENPEATPFPMTGMGLPGSPMPGFDYRLYDDTGRRVDFGISCYKRFDVFQVLRNAEDPRVLRQVSLKDVDWNASWFIRSEWTVPTPAPAAPSLVKKSVVGTWADLKKQ